MIYQTTPQKGYSRIFVVSRVSSFWLQLTLRCWGIDFMRQWRPCLLVLFGVVCGSLWSSSFFPCKVAAPGFFQIPGQKLVASDAEASEAEAPLPETQSDSSGPAAKDPAAAQEPPVSDPPGVEDKELPEVPSAAARHPIASRCDTHGHGSKCRPVRGCFKSYQEIIGNAGSCAFLCLFDKYLHYFSLELCWTLYPLGSFWLWLY